MTTAARKRIDVFGAGALAAECAQMLAGKSLGHVTLLDVLVDPATDPAHVVFLNPDGKQIRGEAEYPSADCTDIAIITAGFPKSEKINPDALMALIDKYEDQELYEGEESQYVLRRSRWVGTYYVVTETIKQILRHSPNCIFVLATEQLDAICLAAYETAGIPRNRIIGPGLSVHNTARGTTVVPFDDFARSVVEIVESIALDNKKTLLCAAYLDGEYGIQGRFAGVPCIVGAGGIEEIIEGECSGKDVVRLRRAVEFERLWLLRWMLFRRHRGDPEPGFTKRSLARSVWDWLRLGW